MSPKVEVADPVSPSVEKEVTPEGGEPQTISAQSSGTSGRIRGKRSMALIALHAADEVDTTLKAENDVMDDGNEYVIGEGPDDL